MTAVEAIQYIHSQGKHPVAPGLDRMRRLLDALGNPQDALRYIHVAGTNGKGSVCAMLDSILRAAGYRVGLFTSPYIRRFQERIQVGGEQISDGDLAEITALVKGKVESLGEVMSEFELITAIGFVYFQRQNVDVVVLEVGLGGRFDPTNVIKNPLLSIITDIDLDHTAQLGNTIQSIAAEKAGIIKEGHPFLYGGKENSACRTIRNIARERNAPFHTVDRSDYHVVEMTLDGTVFDFQNYTALHLPLLGSYQPFNAAIVLTALRILEEGGMTGSEDDLRRGLSSVRWPSRFELMRRDPIVICDGGHNPQGVAAAVKSIQTYFPEQKVNLLSGVMADKDYDEMIESLRPIANRVYTVAPDLPRALPAEEYASHFRMHRIEANAYASVKEAYDAAIADSYREEIPLLCLGSLYLYHSISELI